MRGMPGIVSGLQEGLPNGAYALELFARDGSLVTPVYAPFVTMIYGIDICEDYLNTFKANFPGKAVAALGDSIEFLRTIRDPENPLHEQTFDLIVVDNPQGIYGHDYTEHFNVVPLLRLLLRPQSHILLCVNLCPYAPNNQKGSLDCYGMDEIGFRLWQDRRRNFYGVQDAHDLPIDWMIKFYSQYFSGLGHPVKQSGVHIRKSAIPGHKNHIGYILFQCQ